ncbi:MAG: hypothetical protein ACOZE5_01455 [Verrucomicrobiota bacterium]
MRHSIHRFEANDSNFADSVARPPSDEHVVKQRQLINPPRESDFLMIAGLGGITGQAIEGLQQQTTTLRTGNRTNA